MKSIQTLGSFTKIVILYIHIKLRLFSEIKTISSIRDASINSNKHNLPLHIKMFNMLIFTSLLLGVLLAANGCLLDPINCTIPDDDLNISSVVIIDATQYCHVDNCTVKIIKTGDEVNITYHNDQYHLGCTTTTLQLLEVNDSSYCEQEEDTLAHVIADYAIVMIALTSNALILIVIIKQRKYTTLPFRLLLVSTVFWMAADFGGFIIFLMTYTIQTSNGACIAVMLTVNSLLHCANFIETEMVLNNILHILPLLQTVFCTV